MVKYVCGREIINLNDTPTYFLKYKHQMDYFGYDLVSVPPVRFFNIKIVFIKTFARILFE